MMPLAVAAQVFRANEGFYRSLPSSAIGPDLSTPYHELSYPVRSSVLQLSACQSNQKAMEDFGGEAVRVTFLHPEVMARLTRRLIVNAPTNICYTTPDAAFIDVSDYKPEDLEARGGRSFADGHRVVRLDPTRADFEDALDAALADDARFDDPTIAEAASVLYAEPPTPVETVLEWIDAPTSRPPATLENSPTS